MNEAYFYKAKIVNKIPMVCIIALHLELCV